MSDEAHGALRRWRARDRGPVVARSIAWMLALGCGAASHVWGRVALAAAIIAGWYVLECVLLVAMWIRARRCEVFLAYVLPRGIGTGTGFALAYVLFLPWAQAIALTYVIVIVLESAYRWTLRKLNLSSWHQITGLAALAAASGRRSLSSGLCARRGWKARGQSVSVLLAASLFVIICPAVLYGYSVRRVVFDTGFYVSQLERSDLYEYAARMAGEAAVDAARGRNREVRRAVGLLSGQDVEFVGRTILSKEWTAALVEQALDGVLFWLQADDRRRVPGVSLPIGDLQRHIQEATSVLLDRHMAALPLCAPGGSASALCRPRQMSAAAYIATHKPESIAIVDEAFAMIPADLDLSTAVTLAPRVFQKPVSFLHQVRTRVHTLERLLAWMGAGCLGLLSALHLSGGERAQVSLTRVGMALWVAGEGTLALSWVAFRYGAKVILWRFGADLLADLPADLVDLPQGVLDALFGAVHNALLPWAFVLTGIGLLTALAVLFCPWSREPRQGGAARTLVIAGAIGLLLWARYLAWGRVAYKEAFAAHRSGEAQEAARLYHRVDQLHPLSVNELVLSARQGWAACRRYLDAERAYQSGDDPSAAQAYEALLAGDPPIVLRDTARSRLVESLYGWAESLVRVGEYERALDRYRYIRDELRDRRVQQAMTDLYLAWGEALQAEGDYRAAIATFQRIVYDVSDPRQWDVADERTVDTYCAWRASLNAGGRDRQAVEMCSELLAEWPSLASKRCPECEP